MEMNLPFEFQPNLGLRLKWEDYIIDYALSSAGNTSSSLYSHIFL
ncbi:MAG: hypothetical protein R2771_09070 [Saprospiraceae bacterium]